MYSFCGGAFSFATKQRLSVFHQMEEIEIFRVLVVRFVLSLMVREISIDIIILISQ